MKSNRIDLIALKDCYFSLKAAASDVKTSQDRLAETLLYCNKRVGLPDTLNADSCLEKIKNMYTDSILKGDFINDK